MIIERVVSNYPNPPRGGVGYRKPIDVGAIVVWAYGREKVHFTPGTIGPAASCWDSVARVERIGMLGGFVDSGLSVGSTVAHDAETVHEAVLGLPRPWPGILITYGKSGLVPNWMPRPRPLIYRPVLSRKGTAKMIRDHNGNALACEVEVTGDEPERIVTARMAYLDWWDALEALALALADARLVDHEVTGPIAPREPWTASLDNTQKR